MDAVQPTRHVFIAALALSRYDNDPQRQEIANELVTELSKQGKQHTQALIVISNLYMLDKREARLKTSHLIPYLRELRDIHKRYFANLPYASELRDLREL